MNPNKFLLAAAVAMALPAVTALAQDKTEEKKAPEYVFTTVKENPISSIKNQYRSGTCWSYSGIGFLESEIMRIKGYDDVDLSEMFIVRNSYHDRAVKYVRLDGDLRFGPGSSCEDVLTVIKEYGIVPDSVYSGMNYGTDLPEQSELDAVLAAYVKAVASNPNRTLTTAWLAGFDGILDAYLGKVPEKFEVGGVEYTPESYRDYLGINPDDYVSVTSFTHHPYYSQFVVEVGDNWRWDTSYNVPLDEMMEIIYNAIEDVEATIKVMEALLPRYASIVEENAQPKKEVVIEKAYAWINPHNPRQQRICLTLTDGDAVSSGDIFYDAVDKCWSHKATTKAKKLFASLDLYDIEARVLQLCSNYYQTFDSMDELAKSRISWLQKKKREEKAKA